MLPIAAIFALSVILLVLSLLLAFSLHTLRHSTYLHFREVVSLRHQYTKIIDEQRAEIRGLTNSYLRDQGKTCIDSSLPADVPDKDLVASRSPFRMRPNPPYVTFRGQGR